MTESEQLLKLYEELHAVILASRKKKGPPRRESANRENLLVKASDPSVLTLAQLAAAVGVSLSCLQSRLTEDDTGMLRKTLTARLAANREARRDAAR
jgi:hypothetical protein